MIDEHSRLLVVPLALYSFTVAACRSGPPRDPYVIRGPAGPSPVQTVVPYVWDSREELSLWIDNQVSRGPISITGEGPNAMIRIESGPPSFSLSGGNRVQWVLRGPDFDAPVKAIKGVRIRYIWTPALRNTTVPVAMPDINASFELSEPRPGLQQMTLNSPNTQEQSGEMVLQDRYRVPFDAHYFYLHSDGGNRGVLEIDSIALARE